MIVTIKVTPEGSSIRVKPAIDRPQTPINPWNIEKQEISSVQLNRLYIIFLQQRNINNLFVVHSVEEIFLIFFHLLFRESIKKELIVFLLDAKNNGSTICIGKR